MRFNVFFKCRSLQLLLCKLFFFNVSKCVTNYCKYLEPVLFLVFFFPNYENEHGFYPFCLVFFSLEGILKVWNET